MGLLARFLPGVERKEAISWAFYDFANSSYALLILSFVFPVYFTEIIAPENGAFYWGVMIGVAALLGGILSPFVGALADQRSWHRRLFVLCGSAAIAGTALLFAANHAVLFAAACFIITNVVYEVGQTLYDSFLVQIAPEHSRGKLSGLGWGLGYLGGVVAMLLLMPLYTQEAGTLAFRLTFPGTALFFLLFALPAFLFLRQHRGKPTGGSAFKEIASTVRNLKGYRDVALFLLGFLLFNDALVTLFAFMAVFARAVLGLGLEEIMLYFLLAQLVAFPATVLSGWVSDRVGHKRMLLAMLMMWCVVIALYAGVRGRALFVTLTLVGGLIVGSSQAIARAWLSRLIPKQKRAEFFGFNGFASKISAVSGPFIYGTVATAAGHRVAMLTLIPFFLAAFAIFARIPAIPSPRSGRPLLGRSSRRR